MRTKPTGFSLAELILSIGFFGLAILTLIGLSIAITRTDSKALERSAGTLIGDQVLNRTIAELKEDNPAGARANFFSGDFSVTPWSKGNLVNARTTFYYEVFAHTVIDRGTGSPLSEDVPGNRLKQVNVHVWWAGEESSTRQGSGNLEVWITQLVSEAEVTLEEETP